MHLYDALLTECDSLDIEVYEKKRMKNKGLYADNIIWINKYLPTSVEKACILAEELGHHYTTAGDILDQNDIENCKQELKARAWAYERLVPLSKIIQAHYLHITNSYELADFLNVTEEFLEEALNRYKDRYGLFVKLKNFTIYFDPLNVREISNRNKII